MNDQTSNNSNKKNKVEKVNITKHVKTGLILISRR